jgi:hypothetical protein
MIFFSFRRISQLTYEKCGVPGSFSCIFIYYDDSPQETSGAAANVSLHELGIYFLGM